MDTNLFAIDDILTGVTIADAMETTTTVKEDAKPFSLILNDSYNNSTTDNNAVDDIESNSINDKSEDLADMSDNKSALQAHSKTKDETRIETKVSTAEDDCSENPAQSRNSLQATPVAGPESAGNVQQLLAVRATVVNGSMRLVINSCKHQKGIKSLIKDAKTINNSEALQDKVKSLINDFSKGLITFNKLKEEIKTVEKAIIEKGLISIKKAQEAIAERDPAAILKQKTAKSPITKNDVEHSTDLKKALSKHGLPEDWEKSVHSKQKESINSKISEYLKTKQHIKTDENNNTNGKTPFSQITSGPNSKGKKQSDNLTSESFLQKLNATKLQNSNPNIQQGGTGQNKDSKSPLLKPNPPVFGSRILNVAREVSASTSTSAVLGTPDGGRLTAENPASGIDSGKSLTTAQAIDSAGALSWLSLNNVSKSLGEQIIESIHASLQQPEKQITIHLEPPDLGKVIVNLQEQKEEIIGLLEVSKAQTRYEIEQALPQLLRNLADSGVQIKKLEVQLNDQQGQQLGKDQSGGTEFESRNPSGWADDNAFDYPDADSFEQGSAAEATVDTYNNDDIADEAPDTMSQSASRIVADSNINVLI